MPLENLVQQDNPVEKSPNIPPLLDCLVIVHFGEPYHSCDSKYWDDHYLEEKMCERADAYRGKPIYIIETSENPAICPRLVKLLGDGFECIPINVTFSDQFKNVVKKIRKKGRAWRLVELPLVSV